MSRLNESDWDLINAFHDGELSDDDAALVERRLATDPSLAEAFKQISSMSRGLKALRPQTHAPTQFTSSKPPKRLSRQYWIGGIAAVIVAVSFAVWSNYPRTVTLLEWHDAMHQENFTVSAQAVRDVSINESLGVHDLTGANLAPVSAQDIPYGRLAHYAGVNGCRLSYFRLQRSFKLPSEKEVQSIAWTTSDGAHHAIVATGMDPEKFGAIAIYLQHVTRDRSRTAVHASMSAVTKEAAPCVG